MKVKVAKNNKNARLAGLSKRGFALLFSVLISSLLLTIGLSIFSIALKELAISTASRQSIHAFYAADSGREHALYRDTKKGDISTFDVTLQGPQTVTNSIPADAPTGNVLVDLGNSSGPNYYVMITKTWHDTSWSKIDTTIVSTGHDFVSGDRVEREIRQDY